MKSSSKYPLEIDFFYLVQCISNESKLLITSTVYSFFIAEGRSTVWMFHSLFLFAQWERSGLFQFLMIVNKAKIFFFKVNINFDFSRMENQKQDCWGTE